MLTTANFPDVMIPAFTRRRTAGLLFFPLVVFGVFVLINVSERNENKYRGSSEKFPRTFREISSEVPRIFPAPRYPCPLPQNRHYRRMRGGGEECGGGSDGLHLVVGFDVLGD